jgi:hypothetical protein
MAAAAAGRQGDAGLKPIWKLPIRNEIPFKIPFASICVLTDTFLDDKGEIDSDLDYWIDIKRSKLFKVAFIPSRHIKISEKFAKESIDFCIIEKDAYGYTLNDGEHIFVLGAAGIRGKNHQLEELLKKDYLLTMSKLLTDDSAFHILVASKKSIKNANAILKFDNVDTHENAVVKIRSILKYRDIYWDNNLRSRRRIILDRNLSKKSTDLLDRFQFHLNRHYNARAANNSGENFFEQLHFIDLSTDSLNYTYQMFGHLSFGDELRYYFSYMTILMSSCYDNLMLICRDVFDLAYASDKISIDNKSFKKELRSKGIRFTLEDLDFISLVIKLRNTPAHTKNHAAVGTIESQEYLLMLEHTIFRDFAKIFKKSLKGRDLQLLEDLHCIDFALAGRLIKSKFLDTVERLISSVIVAIETGSGDVG